MSIVPEKMRLDFTDQMTVADNDARTTGFFALLVAPTDSGFSRDVVLAHGQLDFEPVLMHVIDVATRSLAEHRAHQQGGRP